MSKKIAIKNNQGLNLDVEVYNSVKDSVKFVIFSTAFATHKDYNPIYRLFAKNLASEGYNAVLYSFTGTGKSEGIFSETTLETQKEDLENVIKYVRETNSDAKICLAGHSLGATISILEYAQNKKRDAEYISAILTWNSSISTKNLYKRYFDYYADESKTTYNHFRELTGEHISSGRKMWESFNEHDNLENLKNVSIPILALFGENDNLIKSEETRKIISTLPKGECKIINGSDHEITSPATQSEVINESLIWLKNNF